MEYYIKPQIGVDRMHRVLQNIPVVAGGFTIRGKEMDSLSSPELASSLIAAPTQTVEPIH